MLLSFPINASQTVPKPACIRSMKTKHYESVTHTHVQSVFLDKNVKLSPPNISKPAPVGTILWRKLNFIITVHCSVPNVDMERHLPSHTLLNEGVKRWKGFYGSLPSHLVFPLTIKMSKGTNIFNILNSCCRVMLSIMLC